MSDKLSLSRGFASEVEFGDVREISCVSWIFFSGQKTIHELHELHEQVSETED